MRKSVISLLALAAVFAVSCNKEQAVEAPVLEGSTHPVTIRGSYVETKTAYANDKVFSWLAGDEISVMEDLDGTVKFDVFTAASEGAATDFSGEITDGASLGQWAVYPSSLEPAINDEGKLTVTLPKYSFLDVGTSSKPTVTSDNPMSNLPLVGQKQADDSYEFSTAMGVVKFSFYDVDESVYYFNVLSSQEPLCGTFTVDEDGTVKLENSKDNGLYVYWFVQPTAEKTLDVYLLVPVGTLSAGLKVWLEDEDENEIMSIISTKPIEVFRNRVTELAPLKGSEGWKSLGYGKYNDAQVFGQDIYVDVPFEQNQNNLAEYRIANPYTKFYEEEGVELTNPDMYLTFRLIEKGSEINGVTINQDGLVDFDLCQTGNPNELWITPLTYFDPMYTTIERLSHNRILKSKDDGTPANIQLAPMYWLSSADFNWFEQNGNVQIVFPGCPTMDMTESIGEVTFDGLSSVSAKVSLGSELTGKVGVGATVEAAAAAAASSPTIPAGTSDIVSLAFSADSPSGVYFFVMQTFFGEEPWSTISQSFNYVNPDQGALTVDDIVGTYSVTANSKDYGSFTDKFSIYASDDETKGDVMIAGGFLDLEPYYPMTESVYGTLHDNGIVEFASGQYLNDSFFLQMIDDEWVSTGNSIKLFFEVPGAFSSLFGGELLIVLGSRTYWDIYDSLSGVRTSTPSKVATKAATAPSVSKAPGRSLSLKRPVEKTRIQKNLK